MPNSRALLLLVLGAGLLSLGVVDHLLIAPLVAVGVDAGAAEALAPWLSAAFATVGFVLLLAGIGTHLRSTARENQVRPYVDALTPFAAEFGRGLRVAGGRVEFEVQRVGQRVEVLLDPRPGGALSVRSAPPARQSLRWGRPGVVPPGRAAAWREVERGPHWQLNAELPVMARPLLAEAALMEVVDRFFAEAQGVAVFHTVSGMEIEAVLAVPEVVDAQVRLGVEIAFQLRRLNG